MKTKQWLIPVLFALAMVLLITAAVSGYPSISGGASQDSDLLWNHGWRAETPGVAMRAVELPVRLSPGETAIVNQLPSSIPPNAYLYVKTDNQIVTAYIDGRQVQTISAASATGRRYAADLPWTAVALTPDIAGKSVRLTFSNTGGKPWVEVYGLRLGSLSNIQFALFKSSAPKIILSFVIALFALALLAFSGLDAHKRKKRLPREYRYMLLFIMFSSVWFYTDSDIGAVFHMASPAYLHIGFISGLSLPVPYLLFCGALNDTYRKDGRIALAAVLLVQVVNTILWFTGAVPLWTIALLYHSLCALLSLWFVVSTRPRGTSCLLDNPLGYGILCFVFSAVFTLAMIYLFPVEDNAFILRLGVLAFLIVLASNTLNTNVEIALQAERFEVLRIREEEYRIAVRHSDKYVIRYDVTKHEVTPGEQPNPLFAAEESRIGAPESAIANGMVAEESVGEFRAFFAAMDAGTPTGSNTSCLRNRDGSYAWYHADYTLIYTQDHKPLQAIISFHNIDAQREKELAYQKWKQSYAEMPPNGMNYYEYNLTRDTFIGEAGQMLPAMPPEVKRSLKQAVDALADHHALPADDQQLRAFFDRDRLLEAFSHGIRSDKMEFRRMGADAQPLWTLASVQLISDPYSSDVQAFLLLKDIDEQKRSELMVQARSMTDPLTGLLNRGAFEELLTDLFTHAEPEYAHAIIMIDVDGFKRVNDTYGHHFGDRVLIDIAGSLRAMMRADDLIARIGGDEYMVCLKNVREGTGFLERRSSYICQALNRQFGADVAISGSVGLSIFPRDGCTFDVLYQKADKALYYAKHHGKNRFVFYHDDLLQSDVNTPSSQSPFRQPAEPEEVERAQAEPMRTLLIVDDVEMNRDVLGEIFRDEYRLLFAENGQQCLDLLLRSETAISAVLLDLIMPGVSGLSVLERIQNDAYMASIPVIVTSAADETEFSLKAIELGATDFVSKPVDPRLVKLRVKNAVHKRETDELRAQNRYLLVQKSDESRHQDELRYMAEHDPLTNIPNKATFYRKTKLMLDKYPDTTFVMVAFDIEKFRVINDIFGHEEGDRLLHYIAQRMQTLYTSRATYSRIDADNFAICLPFEREALARRVADNETELKEYDLSFDIVLVYGLYVIEDRNLPVSIMHDRAEMAKRTIKGNYVRRYAYYDDTLRSELLGELEIVNTMNSALLTDQFEVYLQPKCTLSEGKIVGAEALVRWNHPTRGVLTPGDFVPIFEKNGFIMKLDAWVWEQVCALLRKWMDHNGGKPLIPVSMNVSRVNIYNPATVQTLTNLADRYGVPRKMMELEITESAYAEDPVQLSGLVTELRNRGFCVQMDDFGSAYSSLNMLKEISVDLLKLDMRFLFGDDQDGRGGTILSSVVRMARYLALPIVVEGVETAEQARFLYSIGCTVAQGYHYYRPMPVAAFEQLLVVNPLTPIGEIADTYPEATMRRVWSIDGDFSLMLSSIPCAASLCEMSGDRIEILRINQEYLTLTHERIERIYRDGTNVRAMTDRANYETLLGLFHEARTTRRVTEGLYGRIAEDRSVRRFHVKITYLSGDDIRSLFFITYEPHGEGGARE